MRRAALALALVVAGCSDEAATAATTTTAGPGGAGGEGGGATGPGGGGGEGGSGGSPIGPAPTELVSRGLLTRYLINEDDSGQEPTQLEDAAPDPLPLPITYGAELGFTLTNGHRGLRWAAIETDWRASTAVDGSKLVALQDASEATIEIVLEIADSTVNQSRLSHIGMSTESGVLTLTSPSPARLQFSINNSYGGVYQVDFPTVGRVVVHGVLASDEEDPEARARVYLNGSPLQRIGGSLPDLGEVLDLGTGRHYVIGNREIGDRSILGAIYYAALYTTALTEEEVSDNAIVLLASDDDP
jgi:hypothetical protein